MTGTLTDALDVQRDEERRRAVRALLRGPLLTPRDAAYAIVRRHAGYLTQWFAREAGWSLHVDAGAARLRKVPGDLGDGSRAARVRDGGARAREPFSRRRYVLACLALAALERAEAQVTLGWLVDRVVAFAADEEIVRAGITFTMQDRDERGDLVAVAQLLLSLGALVKVAGDEQAFVNRTGDALYDVDRRVLAVLLATRRGPSLVGDGGHDARLTAITEDLVPDTEDGRNRVMRHTLTRRLLDDPLVYYADLTAEQRAYLDVQRGPLLKRLTEATGLLAEVRAEGIALLDPTREATDFGMPEEGTEGHATLLLAEHLSACLRDGKATVTVEAAERRMRGLIAEHRAHWRKNVRDPGAEQALTAHALDRLAALGLVRLSGAEIAPLPALARFGYLEPTIIGKKDKT
ncbi:TIGR02678 family protein [Actinomadura sp. WMMB 499]|uniref:TIGR02678 family protein n=1 Tax=Actinomadura sp. WMMB 499 TaxID=1219491 RepID=UPI001245FB8C|nr:TIGR02678 family protein [Actinomadura sp. WMMB 499]QFG26270.1 TIGR02678 family protein [Actinomadura sp. WMMB 499]